MCRTIILGGEAYDPQQNGHTCTCELMAEPLCPANPLAQAAFVKWIFDTYASKRTAEVYEPELTFAIE